jgi:hypothetical protein
MKFSKHAFISYTHIDNQKLAGQDRGWVTLFHETLRAQLEFRLGEVVDIWRDDKLSGNDVFRDEIAAQLSLAALLVAVLSPRYLLSPSCRQEAAEFCSAAQQSLGVEVKNKSRVIKALMLPVESTGLPDPFHKSLGIPFYRSKDKVAITLDPAYGQEMVGEFNHRVAMLAQELVDTIEALRTSEQNETSDSAAARHTTAGNMKGTVYLAESGWDRDPERKQLEIELRNHGYTVVPEGSLPSREQECRAEIEKLLASSRLSVHLIGKEPGMIPSGPAKKTVDALQNELALAQSRSRGLRRILWVPAGGSEDLEHQKFIESLHRSEDAQFGADLVTEEFESLKGAVLSALRNPEKGPSGPDSGGQDEHGIVYVICDRRDSADTVPLRRFLNEKGFEAKRPLFDGDAAAVRAVNESLLNQCQAAIIFYGAADEYWWRSTDSELTKVKRRVPFCTYVTGPLTDHKAEMIDLGEGAPINGLSGLPQVELERFAAKLQRKAASGGTGK